MDGDPVRVDAARLRAAMGGFIGLGTDEAAVWEVLDGKTSEKRAAIANAYKQMYGVELKAAIQFDFSDNPVDGDELSKTLTLYVHGGLSPAEKLYYAMKGWGTDEATIRAVLSAPNANIGQIKAEYESKFGNKLGPTLEAALQSELSGRDWLEVQHLLNPAPSLEVRVQRMEALRDFERAGAANTISRVMLAGYASEGDRLDQYVGLARIRLTQAMFDGTITPEERQGIEEALAFAGEDLISYRLAKDSLASAVDQVMRSLPQEAFQGMKDFVGYYHPGVRIFNAPRPTMEAVHAVREWLRGNDRPAASGAEILAIRRSFRGRLPGHLLPVANSFGGSIWLSLAGEDRGSLYLRERDDNPDRTGDNLKFLTPNFDNFLNALVIDKTFIT